MPPTRDPFQQPTLDNDDSYLGDLQASKKLPSKNPTHLTQQQEPWSRLHSTPTITSMRRDAYYFDPEVIPKDDLDFRLAALYNHHTEAFKNKNEILLHQKTTQDIRGTNIQFPGEFLTPPTPPITFLANIRHWINPKKESIHSIQGSIVSPHTAATNGGYSRKKDDIHIFVCLVFETVSRRLECNDTISAHCNLRLLYSSDAPASASQVAEITGTRHLVRLIFVILVERGFTMLARLVLNSWPQVICLLQLPKVLGLQAPLVCQADLPGHAGNTLPVSTRRVLTIPYQPMPYNSPVIFTCGQDWVTEQDSTSKQTNKKTTQTNHELTIPNNFIGCVIGLQDANINEICRMSGTQIKTTNPVEGSSGRQGTITGSAASISLAQ
ncbi:Protein C1orf194 [Plecturocebus cupreus]